MEAFWIFRMTQSFLTGASGCVMFAFQVAATEPDYVSIKTSETLTSGFILTASVSSRRF